MSAEYAGKRQRRGVDGRLSAVIDPAKTSATSSADLESMLKQALGRIDSLEKQHEQIKMSMERETRALRDDIDSLKEENTAIQASTEREAEARRDDVNALKRENKALKWSIDRLASKAMVNWKYPVWIQSDEYWSNKGYDDSAVVVIKNAFLGQLKKAVSKLEHGVCDRISLGNVAHDGDLMRHWDALFQSFRHINRYGTGVQLCFVSIGLNEELMRRICHNVRQKNIRLVSFDSVAFTNLHGAISELGNALKSSKLKSLQWDRKPIASTEDMTLFTRVLSQNNSVDELKFTRNGNDNTQALLSGVDFSTYKVLDFSNNNLQTNGRTDIPDLIAADSLLESLCLSSNRLNDDDAVLIAQSLGGNTLLRKLDVADNNIQERGMRALYEAAYDISTLNALSDSNHSCVFGGLTEDFDLEAINSDRGSNSLYVNRMRKMHKLMVERYCNGDGNVPHLNMEMGGEDSVLLAPFVMESVVRRHDAFPTSLGFPPQKRVECSLGLLYELVKDWKMTELFSFRKTKQ